MTVYYHGNAVDITFSIGDTPAPITLADGYSDGNEYNVIPSNQFK